MDLVTLSPHYLGTLHSQAYQIYNSILRERDKQGINLVMHLPYRPIYTMEALYHYLQKPACQLAGRNHIAVCNASFHRSCKQSTASYIRTAITQKRWY